MCVYIIIKVSKKNVKKKTTTKKCCDLQNIESSIGVSLLTAMGHFPQSQQYFQSILAGIFEKGFSSKLIQSTFLYVYLWYFLIDCTFIFTTNPCSCFFISLSNNVGEELLQASPMHLVHIEVQNSPYFLQPQDLLLSSALQPHDTFFSKNSGATGRSVSTGVKPPSSNFHPHSVGGKAFPIHS